MSVSFPKGGFVVSAVKKKLEEIERLRGVDIDDKVVEKLAEIFERYTKDDDLPALQNEGLKKAKAKEIFDRIQSDIEKLFT